MKNQPFPSAGSITSAPGHSQPIFRNIFSSVQASKMSFNFFLAFAMLFVGHQLAQAQACNVTDDFSTPVTIGPSQAPGVWYTDRYAPNGFFSPSTDLGGTALKHSINMADGAVNRAPAFQGAFYNTQGRKFDLPAMTRTMKIDLYVPSAWATTNKREAGLWGTAVNISNGVSGYPIIEFTSDGVGPRFRGYESGGPGVWVDMGLPAGFVYNAWYTLAIEVLNSGEFLYKVGNLQYTTTTSSGDGSVRLANIILQGHNYDPTFPLDATNPGVTYDIYWDSFVNNVYTVKNTSLNLNYCSLQAAIDAASNGDVIELLSNISEGLVLVNKEVTIDGNGFTLNSTSPIYGIEIASSNVAITDLILQDAGTYGIQTDCGADFLNLTNVTVNSSGNSGISIYGSDNCSLINITSTNNGGNGVNVTNSDNTTINGITTSGNAFMSGFNAGIGLFTSNTYCLPAGIAGFSLGGAISIAETTKVYSQKASAADPLTGISGTTIEWAVGIGALDRNYWPSKAVAYTVVDALFEAPYSYPNTLIYVAEVATENYYVEDDPNGDASPPMLVQTAVNFEAPGETIFLEAGTYNERVTLDKTLTLDGGGAGTSVLDGTGLAGTGSGITLNTGVTNVTIKDLTVKSYTGASPNSYAGIYAIGGNDNLTVTDVDLADNLGGSGFYANGPITNVLLNNVDAHGHTNVAGAARGIVIWNGLKSNITITNCEVYNNNCCGIELQDGTASGVTMTGNDIHDNGDNGIGVVGLQGPGVNSISSNTLLNNGRFGIEIKNPNGSGANSGAGSIVVSNNNVSRNVAIADLRDISGIAVFRRGVQPGNVDVPNGVVVTTNTVSGYTQPSTSEGFGIVIEGTNHTATGNIINNNDVGLQQQAGHTPYPGDGDQSNLADTYFGRGNSPMTCGNTVTPNTYSGNGVNTRSIGVGAGLVINTNTSENFCSIQAAIDDANTVAGHTITVAAGTFVENVIITKGVNIVGAGQGVTIVKPAFSDPNCGGAGGGSLCPGSSNIMLVQADNVSISNMTLDGDNTSLTSSVVRNGADIDARNGIITDHNTGVYNNLVVNNVEVKNIYLRGMYASTGGTFTFSNNTVTNVAGDGGSIAMFNFGGAGSFTGNTVSLANDGIASNHSKGTTYTGNIITLCSSGIHTDNNGSSGGVADLISGNTVSNGAVNSYGIFTFAPYLNVTVQENTLTNLDVALASAGSYTPGVTTTFTRNTINAQGRPLSTGMYATTNIWGFTPGNNTVVFSNNFISNTTSEAFYLSTDATYTLNITANNNSFTSNTVGVALANAGTLVQNYQCNWWGSADGAQVVLAAAASTSFTPWLVSGTDDQPGTPGFQPVSGACSGTPVVITSATPTPETCAGNNGAIQVSFSGGTAPYDIMWTGGGPVIGVTSPYSITGLSAGAYGITVTDSYGTTGTASVNVLFNGVTNTTLMTTYATIQAAINAANPGNIITVCAGTYAEDIIVNKSLTILGPNSAINPCSGSRVAEAIVVPATAAFGTGEIIHVAASGVTISGFTIDGDNPLLVTGHTNTTPADIDVAEGVTVYETGVNNLTVTNNIIQNLSYFGVTLYDYPAGVASTGHTIANNKIQNLGTYDTDAGAAALWGGGVLLYNNQYAAVTNNCMENVRIGLQTGNYYTANPGSSTYQTISGNTISARRRGIFHNLAYSSASPFTLSSNTITGVANANESTLWDGILLSSMTVASTASGNIINGSGSTSTTKTGISVWNCQTAPLVSGGTISGVGLGVNVNNFEGYPSAGSNAGNTFATIDGVTVTGATIAGIRVNDNPSNTNNATVSAEVKGNTTVSGSPAGILVFGSDATGNVHNNASSITGNTIGVDLDGGSASLYQNNIYANGTGVRVINDGKLTSTTENFIKTNTVDGIRIEANAGIIGGINDNDLSGNTGYAINDLKVSPAVAATCNWYGSNVPATVAAEINGNVTYTPYLASGTDNAMMTDGFQPTGSCSAPCMPFMITTNSTSADCPPATNGTAFVISVSGGTAPYTYAWSTMPVQTGAMATGLAIGMYTVTVTDVYGCSSTSNVNVNFNGSGPVHNANSMLNYCTIQAAIDAATPGDVINVDAGTYTETIVVNKSLTINGPNSGASGCSSRAAEAIIMPPTSQPFYDGVTEVRLMQIEASNVSVKGFTFNGDNPSLLNSDGGPIDAADGIDVYSDVSAVTIENNIFVNLNEGGATGYPSGAASFTGNVISNNKFDNIPGIVGSSYPLSGYGIAVLIYNNFYADVEDNCMTNVRIGVQTGNYNLSDAGNSRTIDGNTIAFNTLGIWHNLLYQSASTFDITNNTLTTANNTTSSGVLISSLQTAVGVNLADNNVSGAYAGVELWNNPTSSTVTVDGGVLSGCVKGVFANNYDGYSSNAQASAYIIDGVTITGGTTGIHVKDNNSNTNGATVSVQIKGNTSVTGAPTGLLIEGGSASASFSGATPASFTGQTLYIDQITNGTDVPATDIDATAVSFDGQTGMTASFAQLFAIEDKINHEIDNKALGFVTVKASNAYATDINAAITSYNNDYTRIRNAVERAGNNWSVNLNGTFDWTEANAATSWSLGNDGVASVDDYEILVPANLNGVTFTAPMGAGTASIQGPGDLAAIDLESVLVFDGGDNQGWTISNMTFSGFDLSIGMFNGAGGSDAYNNTTITNNVFNIPTDLNATAAPSDAFQNIGIHYSFGTNQTISNNTFNVPGDGVSNGSNFSTTVCMQSNTSGGSVYNGLQITGNTTNILNAQSATPQVVLGIWENGHAHTSNITVSNNQFLNLSGTNNPVLNLQRAFRVTSHSGAGSTVTYSGNTAQGANIGFQWIAGSNFSAQMPVVMTGNNVNGNDIGMLIQSNGKALLTSNNFDAATDNNRDVQIQAGSVVTTGGANQWAGEGYYVENLSATALNITGETFDQADQYRRTDRMYDALDNPVSGLVRFNNNNLYVSAPATGLSDETIPNAISAAAATGDVINIETGSYTSGLDATSKEVTVAPGASPGCVTLAGDMVLTGGDVLAMEINGTTPCSTHDQFIVNGTVTLGGANLNATLGYVPVNADQIIIIDNDGGDAVVGQFAQGGSITLMGNYFLINYAGGDGNDVVLTLCAGVKNTTTMEVFCTIQEGVDDPQTLDGHTLLIAAGTYNERVTLTKQLTLDGAGAGSTILDGTGLAGTGNGITINSGIINVTIKDLTVRDYAGANPNASAGIYGVGGNNNLTVTDVDLADNIGGSGFYANGPIDNVLMNNVDAHGHTNINGAARGIVIWNGHKSNITITNCEVYNNNCCGIELQDGSASGVTMTGNNVHDNWDNGIGIVGLDNTTAANLVGTNMVTNNGRFGIEIKNPNGNGTNTVISGNTVTQSASFVTLRPSEVRDIAGIAVFRRGLTGSNVDVPNGVRVTGNTVSGYIQDNGASVSEGFGIVIEGTNHTATGNTINNNDVGLQQQAGHTPYPGDGDQNNIADTYFGRGNSPMTCGNNLTGNTFTGNGLNTRDVGVGAGLVINTNTGKNFCSIQAAIDDATTLNGHVITIAAGTYNENVNITKELTLTGAGNGSNPATNTVLTPAVSCSGAGFTINAANVTIQTMYVTNYQTAVLVNGVVNPTINNMALVDYCLYGVNFAGVLSTSVAITQTNIIRTTYLAGTVGVRAGTASGVDGLLINVCTITGNTQGAFISQAMTPSVFNDITIQNSNISDNLQKGLYFEKLNNALLDNLTMNNNGTDATYNNNNGIDINLKYSAYANITIQNCDITNSGVNGTATDPDAAAAVTIKARDDAPSYSAIPASLTSVIVANNRITGPKNGIRFGEYGKINNGPSNVTVQENDLSFPFANKAVIRRTNNDVYLNCNWHGSTSLPVILATFAEAGTGSTVLSSINLNGTDVSGNAGFQPAPFSCGCPSGNLVTNLNTPETFCSIQAAIDDSDTEAGDVLVVGPGTYIENVVVNKSLTIRGPNYMINPCSGSRVAEAIVVPATKAISSGEIFHVAASNVTITGFTIDGDNTALASGYSSTNGADIDAAEGITVYETGVNGLTVTNNIIQNLSYFGVTLYDYPAGVASSGHTISNNKIQNMGTYDAGSGIDLWGGGVLLYNNQYAAVTNNCMENVRLGIQTGNYYSANPGSSTYQMISGNTIAARRRGIFHNLAYTSASPYTLSGNTITGVFNVNETAVWDGILLSSMSVASTSSGNIINGSGVTIPKTGISVWNCQTAPLVSGGTISGVGLGVNVNNFEGYPSTGSNAGNTFATIDGVTVTGATIAGIRINDNPLNTNGATVSAEVKGNTTVTGSPAGILVSGSGATGNVHNNLLSIHGNAIGIDVDGGAATINNNHIYDNGIGVRFTNDGTGNVNTNKFFDALKNGVDIQRTATADAGSVVASPDNWLAGTTYGVENQSTVSIDASLNYWNDPSGPGAIAAGAGAKVTTNVIYCPWLEDEPTAFGGTGLPISSPVVTITFAETSGAFNNDGIICSGAPVTLDATTAGALSYLWGGGQTTPSILVNPASTTVYTVTVTFAGCTDDAMATVTVDPMILLITNPASQYAPASFDLTAAGITSGSTLPMGTTFTYFMDMALTMSVAVPTSVTLAGTYYVLATSPAGCTTSAPVVLTVNADPCGYANDFDTGLNLSNTDGFDLWYTDRYNPFGFVASGGQLIETIDASDGATSRPPAYSGAFYNTQGRKYNLIDGTEAIEAQLYIPAAWSSTGRRMAGLWGTAFNVSNAVSGFPIIEFTSDAVGMNPIVPRFRVWESGTGVWVDLGMPAGFVYDQWVTLRIQLLASGEFLFTVVTAQNDLQYTTTTSAPDASVDLGNVILQGHNTTAGVTYTINWDNLNTTTISTPVITAAAAVCKNSTGNNASVTGGGTYVWTIDGGTITSGDPTASNITYTAGMGTQLTLHVEVTNGSCVTTISKVVVVNPLPDATITTPPVVAAGAPMQPATVPDAGAGATYVWSITNGTITSGQGTSSIMYTAGSTPSLTINVTVTNSFGCVTTGTVNVTVIAVGASSFAWVPDNGAHGSCPAATNCCTDVICYGLQYTPGVSGNLTSYTTGFTANCLGMATPIVSNQSCVMTDNSFEINECVNFNAILFNSSGNAGFLPVMANVPVITHKVCFSLSAGESVTITEDMIIDLSASVDLTGGGQYTEYPSYTTTTLSKPLWTAPMNGASTVSCPALAVTPTPPTVLDYCGNPVNATLNTTIDVPPPVVCEGTRTYNYTYTDCAGYSMPWTYTYTIEREDFVIGTPDGSSTVACIALAVEPVPPAVIDNCGNPLTPSAAVVSGTYTTCEGTRIYTFTYIDCESNTHDWVYTYTIEREDFTIGTPNGSSTVACIALAVEPVPPAVTDNCGNPLTPSAAVVSGTYTTCEGTRIYTFTYTDCESNTHDWVYTYTIEREDFTIGTPNGSSTVACIALAVEPTPPAVTDNCGNPLTPSAAVVSGTYTTCEGTRIYTFTYTDCEGNTHDWVYTYTIEREDFTIGTSNGSSTVACIALAVEPAPPAVADNCGNPLTPSAAVVSGTYTTCEGTRIYTFTYTDCEGNTHDWVYTYTIEREDFTIGTPDGSSTVACIALAVEPAPPAVTDNCGNPLTPAAAVVSGTYTTCEGTRIYTFTYTDCEGNTHDWVYTYTIERLPFTVPAPGGSTVNCPLSTNTVPTPPVVTDNCGQTLTPTGPLVSPIPGCGGTRTYTWTYTDCEGNTLNWVYTYTVVCDPVTLSVFLEGPYNTMTNLMVPQLNIDHVLPGQNKLLSPNPSIALAAPFTPFGQPYSGAPWFYTGNMGMNFGDPTAPGAPMGVTPYPADVVDWVLVTVRENGILPANNVWKCAGWVHTDGEVTFPEPCGSLTFNPSLEYFVLVEHRNHLAVLDTVDMPCSGYVINWDFTTENSYKPVFRYGEKEVEPGVWAMHAANGEQISSRPAISSADRTTWRLLQNALGYSIGDYNMNSAVNSNDETVWKFNQNKSTGIIFQ